MLYDSLSGIHCMLDVLLGNIAMICCEQQLADCKGTPYACLQVLLLLHMLHLAPWCYFPLTLQYLAVEYAELVPSTGKGAWKERMCDNFAVRF